MKHLQLSLLSVALLTSVLLFGEGTRQVAPNGSIDIMGTNTTDIAALHLDHPSYDNFASYTNPDVTDRLQIRLIDPSSECIYLGFSQGHLNVTGMNPTLVTFEFRVKDPMGNVVYGPVTVNPADANVNDWNEGFMGPEEINGPGGYDAMVITSTDLTSGGWSGEGDYYIEFREASGQPFLIDFWDITVADCSGTFPQELPGRVWSYNWAFFAINDFGFPERPFNGAFYVCAPDPDNANAAFVTKIDFNGSGFRPAAFVVAFNSFGSMNTGNVTEDRKSVQNLNSTQAEYAIFLNDPIEFCETAVVGEIELFGVTRCSADEFCIKYQSSKEGQIDLLLDFDGPDSMYTPGTADRLITVNVSAEEVGIPSCIAWDGTDGLGNPISEAPGTSIPLLISYAQGVYHFPIYDAEFMDNGFNIEAIRPTGPEPLLYYDDSNIDTPSGSGEPDVQLAGCTLPCHTWSAFNDPNVPGFGNLNTINSWWFAQQIVTQEVFVLPTYFTCNVTGPDVICAGDSATLSWTSVSLPDAGVDPDIVSIQWSGPDIIGEPVGNEITIGSSGTYFADMTWLTPFGDTCSTSCEFTLDEATGSTIEIDTTIIFGDTLVINDEEYFESGEYEQVLVGANGCDSILIIRLTIPQTVLYYDLDACKSYIDDGTNADYSEFSPQYPDPLQCGDLEASNLYRDNPDVNPHSCTPGVDSSVAMCVGSLDGCDYDPSSDKAVVFEVTISPDTANNVVINSLSFFEKGPEEFDWIDGFDGPNNYPTLYGLRILKDGMEIFRVEGVATERTWNEEVYDFTGLDEFVAEDTAVYRFELLGYCTFNNGSTVNAWDLDEFTVQASCSPKVSDDGVIEGTVIELRSGESMEGVAVQVSQDNTFVSFGECFTDGLGAYLFDNALVDEDNYVRAWHDEMPLEGVTAFDLLAMQKHMLGLEPFEDPYQFIAADVNLDGELSALDILELRKLMLGQINGFSRNASWRFFDLGGELSGDPFEWTEIVSLPNFEGFAEAVDFGGVKIGDVVDTRSGLHESSASLYIRDMQLEPNGEFLMPVYAPKELVTQAMQFELEFDDVEIVGVEAGIIPTESIHLQKTSVRVVWGDALNNSSGEALFYLKIRSHRKQHLRDAIGLVTSDLKAVAFGNANNDRIALDLQFTQIGRTSLIELTAMPNPANAQTVLTFNSPVDRAVVLKVMDITGSVLFTQEINAVGGMNQVAVRRAQLNGYHGLVICQLETGSGTGVIKVVF